MDKETKQLLADLFKENQDLILAAVQTSDDEELVAKVETAANSNNRVKDYYVVTHKSGHTKELTRPKTFKWVVEYLCSIGKTYEQIVDLLKQWSLGGNNIGPAPYANNVRDTVFIDGTKFYLNMNKWNLIDIQHLVDGANHSHLNITITPVNP